MTITYACPACGHINMPKESQGVSWRFCANCGQALPRLIVPPTINRKAPVNETSQLLWNPVVIAIWGIPLGFAFSSVLVALNWHGLRKHWAATSAWVLGLAYCFFVQNDLLQLVPWPWPFLLGFIVWFPLVGLPQVLHFRKHLPSAYPRRGWLLPVAIGVAVQATFLIWAQFEARAKTNLTPDDVVHAESRRPNTGPFPADQVATAYQNYVFQVQVTWKERGGFLWLSWKDCGLEGSGVLISNSGDKGLLVTNKHVIAPFLDGSQSPIVSVRLRDGDQFVPAEITALAGQGLDLALLQINITGYQPYALHAGRIAKLHPGEPCITLGNALGDGIGVTAGVYSKLDEVGSISLLRTSAPVSHGNSGGALVALTGPQLIGVVVASREEGQNFNYAIPVDYVLDERSWNFGEGREDSHALLRQFQERNP